MKTRNLDTALDAFRNKGGTLRTRDLIALGVHTDALYTLRDSGRIVELGRGPYRHVAVPAGDRMTGNETKNVTASVLTGLSRVRIS